MLGLGVLVAPWIAACSAGTGQEATSGTPSVVSASTSAPSPGSSGSARPVSGRTLSLVVFGDSWGYGAHCDGCTPWPKLLPSAYRSSGIHVRLTDLAENGGDSASLVAELRTKQAYRDAVAGADVVVFNMGINDLEKTLDPVELKHRWRKNLDGMLDIVDELRDGRPTAVRMVGVSNEYLFDTGLQQGLGTSAPVIFGAFNEVSCAVAADHGGKCVDLRPVLNGRDGKRPADPNTQSAMNAVSAAVAEVGLAELGVS